jgi:hypothetical protein
MTPEEAKIVLCLEAFQILRPTKASMYLEVRDGSPERFTPQEKSINKRDFANAVAELQRLRRFPKMDYIVVLAGDYAKADAANRERILDGFRFMVNLNFGRFIR